MGLQDPSIDATPVRTAFLLLQTLPAALALKGFLQKAHLKGQVHGSGFFFAGTFIAQEGGGLWARSVTKEVRLLGFTVRTAGAVSVEFLSVLSQLGLQTYYTVHSVNKRGLPNGSAGKESACQGRRHRGPRDAGSIPGSARSPGGGNGNPLQYSCLGNPMDRGAWWARSRKELDTTDLAQHTPE